MHVPPLVLVSVYGAAALTAHPEAVPFTAANVTAPMPEPPGVVKVNGVPNGPEVDVTVSGA